MTDVRFLTAEAYAERTLVVHWLKYYSAVYKDEGKKDIARAIRDIAEDIEEGRHEDGDSK